MMFGSSIMAQFPPQAGITGTTAIHADSNVFIDWANSCIVERGFFDISNQSLGTTTFGNAESGINKADNNVVSLGDAGIATLGFITPIANGQGWDFAIFENSFSDDFLELAFVEVSSNGIDYYRFDGISLTQQETQISTFGVTDATNINNLAGKYRVNYGVPFDLDELKENTLLDINNIISIRIIDVIGSIDPNYATFDSEGNIINDPWPTPFESSGFDLDAVGVINNRDNTSISNVSYIVGSVYPNPAKNYISLKSIPKFDEISIVSMHGSRITKIENKGLKNIDISFLQPGYYIIYIHIGEKIISDKLIVL